MILEEAERQRAAAEAAGNLPAPEAAVTMELDQPAPESEATEEPPTSTAQHPPQRPISIQNPRPWNDILFESLADLKDRMALLKKKKANRNLWPRSDLFDLFEAQGNCFEHQRSGAPSAFAQYFGKDFLLDIIREGKGCEVVFTCTLCHSMKRSAPKDVRLHVCNTSFKPSHLWHMVDNCLAIVCHDCLERLKAFYFDAPIRCINCRESTFVNLNFEERPIHPDDTEVQHSRNVYVRAHRQEPAWRKGFVKNWKDFCDKGMGLQNFMITGMAQFRGYAETFEPQHTPGQRPIVGYWRHKDMREVAPLPIRQRFDVPDNVDTVQGLKDFYLDYLREHWAIAEWSYRGNQMFNNMHKTLPGLAVQCPQNQRLRDHLIAPVFVSKDMWAHFLRILGAFTQRVEREPPVHFKKDWTPPSYDPDHMPEAPEGPAPAV